VAERWITALRNRRFFEIGELTLAIRELLVKLNNRPFRKRDGSRASVFHGLDKSALHALPAERFDLSQRAKARVNIDCHVCFEGNCCSVPYHLVHETVEIRSTPATVKIFHKGRGVTSHFHSRGKGQMVTTPDHHPKSHREHLEWTPSRMVHWASGVGPTTARLFESILADQPHPEMGYRGCLGIIRLAEKYSGERTEAAAPAPCPRGSTVESSTSVSKPRCLSLRITLFAFGKGFYVTRVWMGMTTNTCPPSWPPGIREQSPWRTPSSFTSSIDNLVKDLERAIKSGVAVARTGFLRAGEGTPVSSDDTEYMLRNGLPHLRGVRFESCNTADGHDGSFIPRCAAGVILCYIRQSMYLV
jgi:hypothetical protein